MNKIKIPKELAVALESAISRYSKTPINKHSEPINVFDKIVENTIKKRWSESRVALNEIPLKYLCEILINGYEVEETPDERILKAWMSRSSSDGSELAWKNGVYFVLSQLKHEIKGINK